MILPMCMKLLQHWSGLCSSKGAAQLPTSPAPAAEAAVVILFVVSQSEGLHNRQHTEHGLQLLNKATALLMAANQAAGSTMPAL